MRASSTHAYLMARRWHMGRAAAHATGYTGSLEDLHCDAPTLLGSIPECEANECTRNWPRGYGIDGWDCVGKRTGESCEVFCRLGFEATSLGPHESTCLADGSFSGPGLSCEPRSCADLAGVGGFQSLAIDTSMCKGLVWSQSC
eukprot:CAMPEP_0115570754 /NCGR_PEP_ID=MMETSP0271-20121206/105864_1 /TAXON_ID=71861 /ORGANISM="Scrippsiella trochoidea, Strain CCMP3099" /LENGTH=143 /DNA_ID=CAMNT_0003005305 /DNA_START=53 /DNA_END=481 /DNA_ORIENTATION=+